MRSAIAVLGFLFVLCGGLFAADDAWLIAPPVVKISSAADREARDEIIKIIADKRDKVSRDGWNLEVPAQGSGVPEKYDVLLYRSNGCFSETRARLEIQVRDGRARWELCDLSGIYRAERPADDVDRLVRRLAYAFHAVEKAGKDKDWGISFTIGPPPHDFEVVSRDDQAPFHLQPKYLQVEPNAGGPPVERIRNAAFADLTEHVFDVAERECRPIAAEEEAREILRRLKAVPALDELDASKTSTGEKLTAGRLSQIGVERGLLGDMAVKHALREALPELQRLSLADELRQLQLAVAADPRPGIVQAIVDHKHDEGLASWAERFALDDRHPERLQWLIDALPRLENDPPMSYRAEGILFSLVGKKLTPEQLEQLAVRFAETKNPQQKVGLANALWRHTQEAKYFSYLEFLARSPSADANNDSRSPRRTAVEHVFRYAVETGKRRAEARSLLKKLLQEPLAKDKPDSFEMFELVEKLGDLGTSEDVAYLAGLAQTGSPYLMSSAVSALAKLDAPRALEVLHARIERWLQRPAEELTYSHEIFSHFELLIFERDTAAIPLLKKAWERLSAGRRPQRAGDEPKPIAECYNPERVIAFLEAKTGPARAEAAIAHFGDRAHYEDRTRMQRLVDQLIAEGAAPERCKLLLHVPDESRRGR